MRIAATWKPRWTRVTSARMGMRRDRVLHCSCAADRDRSRNRWSLCVLMNMEALSCWNVGDLFVEKKTVHQSFWESNTTACLWPELDTGDSTESFCPSRDCDVYLFPAKLSVTESLAFGTLWMFLFSIQASGAGRSTFFFFSAAVKGREKQLVAAMGAEHWELTFKSAWLNCPAWRSRSSPTAEKVSTLTHVGAVSGVCGLSPVSAMKFCRTVPSTEARKSMTMSNTLMRVTTECVHACVHRWLDKKKKESDVNFYLFSKHLESGNVDNCIIWS